MTLFLIEIRFFIRKHIIIALVHVSLSVLDICAYGIQRAIDKSLVSDIIR